MRFTSIKFKNTKNGNILSQFFLPFLSQLFQLGPPLPEIKSQKVLHRIEFQCFLGASNLLGKTSNYTVYLSPEKGGLRAGELMAKPRNETPETCLTGKDTYTLCPSRISNKMRKE